MKTSDLLWMTFCLLLYIWLRSFWAVMMVVLLVCLGDFILGTVGIHLDYLRRLKARNRNLAAQPSPKVPEKTWLQKKIDEDEFGTESWV